MEFVSKILNFFWRKKLIEYFESIDGSNNDLIIFEDDSQILIKQCFLKKDKNICEDSEVYIKNAFCENLRIQIPKSSKDHEITIDSINLLIISRFNELDMISRNFYWLKKIIHQQLYANLTQKTRNLVKGYDNSTLLNFLKNIKIIIKQIHIRIENQKDDFVIGIKLEDFFLNVKIIPQTDINEMDINNSLISPQIIMKNFTFYVDCSNNNMFKNLDRIELLNKMRTSNLVNEPKVMDLSTAEEHILLLISEIEVYMTFSTQALVSSQTQFDIKANILKGLVNFPFSKMKEIRSMCSLLNSLLRIVNNYRIIQFNLQDNVDKTYDSELFRLFGLYHDVLNKLNANTKPKDKIHQNMFLDLKDIETSLSESEYIIFHNIIQNIPLEVLIRGSKLAAFNNTRELIHKNEIQDSKDELPNLELETHSLNQVNDDSNKNYNICKLCIEVEINNFEILILNDFQTKVAFEKKYAGSILINNTILKSNISFDKRSESIRKLDISHQINELITKNLDLNILKSIDYIEKVEDTTLSKNIWEIQLKTLNYQSSIEKNITNANQNTIFNCSFAIENLDVAFQTYIESKVILTKSINIQKFLINNIQAIKNIQWELNNLDILISNATVCGIEMLSNLISQLRTINNVYLYGSCKTNTLFNISNNFKPNIIFQSWKIIYSHKSEDFGVAFDELNIQYNDNNQIDYNNSNSENPSFNDNIHEDDNPIKLYYIGNIKNASIIFRNNTDVIQKLTNKITFNSYITYNINTHDLCISSKVKKIKFVIPQEILGIFFYNLNQLIHGSSILMESFIEDKLNFDMAIDSQSIIITQKIELRIEKLLENQNQIVCDKNIKPITVINKKKVIVPKLNFELNKIHFSCDHNRYEAKVLTIYGSAFIHEGNVLKEYKFLNSIAPTKRHPITSDFVNSFCDFDALSPLIIDSGTTLEQIGISRVSSFISTSSRNSFSERISIDNDKTIYDIVVNIRRVVEKTDIEDKGIYGKMKIVDCSAVLNSQVGFAIVDCINSTLEYIDNEKITNGLEMKWEFAFQAMKFLFQVRTSMEQHRSKLLGIKCGSLKYSSKKPQEIGIHIPSNTKNSIQPNCHELELKSLEFFITNIRELKKHQLQRSKLIRKTILQKTEITLRFADIIDQIIFSMTLKELQIQSTLIDYMLIHHTIEYEKAQIQSFLRKFKLLHIKKIIHLNPIQYINFAPFSIKIIILNDLENDMIPFYFIMCEVFESSLSMSTQEVSFDTKLHTALYFYNYKVKSWEAVIEPVGFTITLRNNDQTNGFRPIFCIFNDTDGSTSVNINISETLIIEIYRCIQEVSKIMLSISNSIDTNTIQSGMRKNSFSIFSQDFDYDDSKDFEHHISPYTIMNLTGYNIEIYPNDMSKTIIPINTIDTFKIDADFNFLDSYTRYTKIILYNNDNDIVGNLLHLNVDSLKNEKYIIDINGSILENNNDNKLVNNSSDVNYIIYSAERRSYRRIIKLMSPFIIENDSNQNFRVALISNEKKIFEQELMPRTKIGLPILDISFNSSIQIMDNQNTEIFTTEIDKVITSKEIKTLSTSKPNILARIYKSLDVPVYKIKLEHTLTIKNYLLSLLQFRLTIKENQIDEETIFVDAIVSPNDLYITKPFPWGSNTVYISVRVYGYNWSQKVIMWNKDYISSLTQKTVSITLQDPTNQKILSLNLFYSDIHQLYIYGDTAVIDETDFGFKLAAKSNKTSIFKALPEYEAKPDEILPKTKWMWLNKNDEIKILKGKGASQSFSTNFVGNFQIEIKGDLACFPMPINIEIENLVLDKEFKIRTNLVKLLPAYVLLNQTDSNLVIKQQQNGTDTIMLKPFEPFGIQWENAKEKSLYVSQIQEDGSNCLWTGRILIDKTKEINFPIRNIDKTILQMLYLYIKKIGLITYCIFEKVADLYKETLSLNTTKNGLMIQNDLDIDLIISQGKIKDDDPCIFELKRGEISLFGWDKPDKPQTICIKSKKPEIIFNKEVNFESKVVLTHQFEKNEKAYTFETEIYQKDSKKILRFFIPSIIPKKKKDIKNSKGMNNFSIMLDISRLNISYILDISNRREELISILIDGFRVQHTNNEINDTTSFKIKFMQIDNNLSNIDGIEPVILTALYPEELNQDNQNFIEICMIKHKFRNPSNIKRYDFIRIMSKPWKLRLDGIMLEFLINSINKIWEKMSKIDGNLSNLKTLRNQQSLMFNGSIESPAFCFFKKKTKLPPSFKNLSTQIFIIDPIKVQATYNPISKTLRESNAHAGEPRIQWIHKIESIMCSISIMDFELNGVKLKNCYTDYKTALEAICNKFFFEIFGNLLVDNTYLSYSSLLLRSLSADYEEFNERNKTSVLKQSDIQMYAETTSSILKRIPLPHTTVQYTLDSLSYVFTSLTMDEKMYQEQIRFRKRKATNVFEGLGQGLGRFFKQTTLGLTGFFSKPVEGMMEEGFGGMAKGLFKGTTGLIFSPIVGIFDAGSKTIEGLANTPYVFLQTKPNNQRLRKPRPFYTINQQIKEYNSFHAIILEELRKINENLYRHMKLYGIHEWDFDEKDKTLKLFIISADWILIYIQGQNPSLNRVIWSIPSKEYKDIQDLPAEIKQFLTGEKNLNELNTGINETDIEKILEELATLKEDIMWDFQ